MADDRIAEMIAQSNAALAATLAEALQGISIGCLAVAAIWATRDGTISQHGIPWPDAIGQRKFSGL